MRQPTTDERLNGGYENVPTVDIHMNQVSPSCKATLFNGDNHYDYDDDSGDEDDDNGD